MWLSSCVCRAFKPFDEVLRCSSRNCRWFSDRTKPVRASWRRAAAASLRMTSPRSCSISCFWCRISWLCRLARADCSTPSDFSRSTSSLHVCSSSARWEIITSCIASVASSWSASERNCSRSSASRRAVACLSASSIRKPSNSCCLLCITDDCSEPSDFNWWITSLHFCSSCSCEDTKSVCSLRLHIISSMAALHCFNSSA
mmetsp:Transcript_67804/g.148835  ORF Transcript_67804/g.148835 Transcript_67804/m.148835 type:complete len:201 (+) Transcript_67804:212-814(+)